MKRVPLIIAVLALVLALASLVWQAWPGGPTALVPKQGLEIEKFQRQISYLNCLNRTRPGQDRLTRELVCWASK